MCAYTLQLNEAITRYCKRRDYITLCRMIKMKTTNTPLMASSLRWWRHPSYIEACSKGLMRAEHTTPTNQLERVA